MSTHPAAQHGTSPWVATGLGIGSILVILTAIWLFNKLVLKYSPRERGEKKPRYHRRHDK